MRIHDKKNNNGEPSHAVHDEGTDPPQALSGTTRRGLRRRARRFGRV